MANRKKICYKGIATLLLGIDSTPAVYTFKPPFDWDKLHFDYRVKNVWIEQNHLRLKWTDGELPYSEIENILRLHLIRSKAIYVKGVEKVKWLQKYFNNIIEIDAVKTPL